MSDEKPYDLSLTKEEQIRKAYISSNYAGSTRLFQLMKDKGSQITKAEVRAFINFFNVQKCNVRKIKDH